MLRVDRLGGIPESSSSPEPGDMDRYGAHLPDAVESAAVVIRVTVKVSTVKVSAAAYMIYRYNNTLQYMKYENIYSDEWVGDSPLPLQNSKIIIINYLYSIFTVI